MKNSSSFLFRYDHRVSCGGKRGTHISYFRMEINWFHQLGSNTVSRLLFSFTSLFDLSPGDGLFATVLTLELTSEARKRDGDDDSTQFLLVFLIFTHLIAFFNFFSFWTTFLILETCRFCFDVVSIDGNKHMKNNMHARAEEKNLFSQCF